MNDSTLAAEENSGSKQQSHITEAVIRIAGNSQDGIQSIGGFLARLAGRSEQDVMTFMTIPSPSQVGPRFSSAHWHRRGFECWGRCRRFAGILSALL